MLVLSCPSCGSIYSGKFRHCSRCNVPLEDKRELYKDIQPNVIFPKGNIITENLNILLSNYPNLEDLINDKNKAWIAYCRASGHNIRIFAPMTFKVENFWTIRRKRQRIHEHIKKQLGKDERYDLSQEEILLNLDKVTPEDELQADILRLFRGKPETCIDDNTLIIEWLRSMRCDVQADANLPCFSTVVRKLQGLEEKQLFISRRQARLRREQEVAFRQNLRGD